VISVEQKTICYNNIATQMGTSVKMIEQHYGHITPAHIAAKLAGPRMGNGNVG
jgi:hypothetical protein